MNCRCFPQMFDQLLYNLFLTPSITMLTAASCNKTSDEFEVYIHGSH